MSNKYDPFKHHRRSVRLKDWNYSDTGCYFITICTFQRQSLFDDPNLQTIAERSWQNIPSWKQAKHVELGDWVVMPDHIHGLLNFTKSASQPKAMWQQLPAEDLGGIIRTYKMAVTKQINKHWQTTGVKIWQQNYYEHIVRDKKDFLRIQRYIHENPYKLLAETEK